MTPLSAIDVAQELGRSMEWLYQNWKNLVDKDGMPRPLSGGGRGSELKWSAVQFYAWLDKDLSKELRDQCAAIRAAIAAMETSPATSAEARNLDDWKTKLEERLGIDA